MSTHSPPEPPKDDEDKEIDVGKFSRPDVRYIEATIEWSKHSLREKIALRLTYAVIVLAVVPIIAVIFFPQSSGSIRDVTAPISSGVIGIYGTIIGFYFGKNK